MADEHAIARYRHWYRKLLRYYPKRYRECFAESMEQTFKDLCRERAAAGKGLGGFVLWMFVETSAGIVRENERSIMMQNVTRRLVVRAVVAALLLMIPLVAMQFTEGVNWDLFDFVVMGALLFGVGLAYELVARRSGKTVYRVAFGVGLVTAFLLFWVNGAVGIIGNENQPANLMYGAVFAVGLIGSLVARFKPRGMAHTLFAAALVQISVPVMALMIWPEISWGGARLVGVFILNAFFAALFAVSALLFLRAADPSPTIRGRGRRKSRNCRRLAQAAIKGFQQPFHSMANEHAIARYRHWYRKLLRFYPRPYRERFGESMEQTFHDLCRERAAADKALFAFVLWMFVETSAGIIREDIRFIIMKAITSVRRDSTIAYRAAVGVAVTAALLLVWMTLAVGTEDDNSGGLMYLGVLVLGIGAILARLRPQGMVRVLFATALAQALVAVIAMISWGQYLEFLILNGIFIALWVGSAFLFRRARDAWSTTGGEERAGGAR